MDQAALQVDSGNGHEPGIETGDDVPPMEALLAKIPASNHELLSELFKGRFVGVRRVDERDLK